MRSATLSNPIPRCGVTRTSIKALDSVLSTKTNFILKKYKDHGTVMAEPAKDERIEM